jgi:hypothetical protein
MATRARTLANFSSTGRSTTGPTPSGTWVTIFTLPDSAGAWLVSASGTTATNQTASNYVTTALAQNMPGTGAAQIATLLGSAFTEAQLDGKDVQIRQTSGVNQTMTFNVVRIF